MPDFDKFTYAPRWMPEANTCKVSYIALPQLLLVLLYTKLSLF